jgi:hypothetical protein
MADLGIRDNVPPDHPRNGLAGFLLHSGASN